MKIALVLTVKNEARILRDNLMYHRAIGAEHIFIYFDNSTDTGRASIEDLDFVTVQNSVPATKYKERVFLDKFTEQAEEHHTARQCLNTYDALQLCKPRNYDWLVSLDADELICTNIENPSQLHMFFSEIDPAIDVVNLKTFEALQQRQLYGNVFAEETLYKTTHRYKGRFEKIRKQLYNPFTKSSHTFSYWFGQHLGKGAIRVASTVIPHNVHRYKLLDGASVRTLDAGMVLHYHAYDATDFIKKFTNFSDHPNTFLSGNKVESIKLLLRDIVNSPDHSEADLVDYFNTYLKFSEKEVETLKRNKYLRILSRKVPPLIEITSVQKVFQQMIRI